MGNRKRRRLRSCRDLSSSDDDLANDSAVSVSRQVHRHTDFLVRPDGGLSTRMSYLSSTIDPLHPLFPPGHDPVVDNDPPDLRLFNIDTLLLLDPPDSDGPLDDDNPNPDLIHELHDITDKRRRRTAAVSVICSYILSHSDYTSDRIILCGSGCPSATAILRSSYDRKAAADMSATNVLPVDAILVSRRQSAASTAMRGDCIVKLAL